MNLWDKFSNLFKSNKTTRLSSYNYQLFWNACETGDLEYIKKVIHSLLFWLRVRINTRKRSSIFCI